MDPLTKTQKRVLDYIAKIHRVTGYSPSYREIMSELGYKSPGAVFRLVQSLQQKGYLTRAQRRSWRSFLPVGQDVQHNSEATAPDSPSSSLPAQLHPPLMINMIGSISGASPPELSLAPTTLYIPNLLIPASEGDPDPSLYGFFIRDSAFLSAHLIPGDLIFLEPTETEITPGSLVLATTQTESIIGHFFDEGDHFTFSCGPYTAMKSLQHTKKTLPEETQIWGVILGSFRGVCESMLADMASS